MPPPRIYLAGPEVFLPNAQSIGAEKVRLAHAAGFDAVFPLDQALDLAGLSKPAQAARIFAADIDLMRRSDLVIANLTPFRGVSADVGTVFEAGFMHALGRPVLGYTGAASDYATRVRAARAATKLPFDGDRAATAVEELDLAENLMIEMAIRASGFQLVRPSADLDLPVDDLSGFSRCLALARAKLLA